jgi:predicted aminopeptidase
MMSRKKVRDEKMLLRIGVTICWVIFASGCSSISYYGQSIIGHSSIMLARQPVEEVMKSADETLKKRLATAIDIRQFAVEQLSLPDNKSYTTYVQLKNDTPVWNVIAATEFSLGAKQWCYPIVGCASYRGYYHKEAAEHYAQKLKEQGYEVAIVGATA